MRFILDLRQTGVTDAKTLAAIERTPRAHFAPTHLQSLALEDRDLPLPHGQAMTRPALVARVVAALDVAPMHSVLEIGTGSGYQAAVLARLARKVVTLDRFASLVTEARARIGEARLMNVALHWRDGAEGFAESAPFDRIVINAEIAAPPDALRAQAGADSVLVAPMRGRLMRWRGGACEDLGPTAFAPLDAGLGAE
jgi:protein-L-isoaspartate(D-aspartate) O-methyltransferase